MVLQDKYKARASRKYQAKHGGGEGGDVGGRGRGRGSSRGIGRGRGRGRGPTFAERNGLVEPGLEEDGDSDEESNDGEEQDDVDGGHEAHSSGDTNATASSSKPSEPRPRSKYSKRKMTSNSWRFEHPSDEEDNPDAEPEPQVDLSRAFEKARLDHYEELNGRAADNHDDEDDDIDTDLAYLHHKAASRAAKPSIQRLIDRPEGYEEAQKANRELNERNDAKMKIWGKLEDGLQARRTAGTSKSTPTKGRKEDVEKRVLEGEDYLDSMLG